MLTFWWKYQDPSNSLGLWSGVSGQHCSLQLLSLRVCSVQHICNTITIKKSTIIVLTLEQIISYSKQVKKYDKKKHYFQLPKRCLSKFFLTILPKTKSSSFENQFIPVNSKVPCQHFCDNFINAYSKAYIQLKLEVLNYVKKKIVINIY